MRRTLVPLVLMTCLVAVPAQASPTGTSGSYDVHVLPDPTTDVSPDGQCGAANAFVLGSEIGQDSRAFLVRKGATLRAEVVPVLNVFAGDVGLDWSLRVYDVQWRELARSSGPPWGATSVSHRASRAQRVWLVACNRRGHPDATITYSLG
ncbi:MAG TPA: hypothetical protein VM097_12120 [Mycobacteriales bacterium]|nr:hypothetical protein [Mycobacteriales bacterium]